MTLTCTNCIRTFWIAIWETTTDDDWVCKYCLEQEGDSR